VAEIGERLAALEREVQRAVELIGSLREDARQLREERAALTERVEGLTREIEALRDRSQTLARLQEEHRRL
jgi:FtsZ-binding cell division protein ZapB